MGNENFIRNSIHPGAIIHSVQFKIVPDVWYKYVLSRDIYALGITKYIDMRILKVTRYITRKKRYADGENFTRQVEIRMSLLFFCTDYKTILNYVDRYDENTIKKI